MQTGLQPFVVLYDNLVSLTEMVLNGLPHSHTMINCSHSHLSLLPGTRSLCKSVWGPFLCDHDKITILDILLTNFWWSQQLLDHESYTTFSFSVFLCV